MRQETSGNGVAGLVGAKDSVTIRSRPVDRPVKRLTWQRQLAKLRLSHFRQTFCSMTVSHSAPLCRASGPRCSAFPAPWFNLSRAGVRSALTIFLLLGLAAHLHAAQPTNTPPDTLEQRLIACAACHGKQGEGSKQSDPYPRIAGKPAGYLYNQLKNFRERRRKYAVMNYMVSYLSDAYLREMAEYYAHLNPPYREIVAQPSSETMERGEALVQRGDPARNLPACAECHGKSLHGMQPAIPGLLGLSAYYIGQQLGAWRIKQRHAKEPDCMAKIAGVLAPDEATAVAAWLAAQPVSQRAAPEPLGTAKLPIECGSLTQR
jgi:cytochrome c553